MLFVLVVIVTMISVYSYTILHSLKRNPVTMTGIFFKTQIICIAHEQ